MQQLIRLKCDSVAYRKGFVEVASEIHDGCVNLELWQVVPGRNLAEVCWVSDVSDSDLVTNCEIELPIEQAQQLAKAMLEAFPS